MVRIGVGEHVTITVVIDPTTTLADPDFVTSCVDVAVMVAVPMPDGVKTPDVPMVPRLVGLTAQVTVLV